MMSAVRCIDLCKTYRQGDEDIKALDHLSIEIEKGDFVCLMSPSGGGKTTLLNAIGGLDIPDSGEVWIADKRIDQMSKGELADLRLANIGFVFQAYNLIPVLTARENVEFVMQVQGVPAADRRDKSLAILEEVGLQGLEGRRPAEMSGGQQQRVAVARAIVGRPKLILADEPTGNLDSAMANDIMDLLENINEAGTTVMMVTHDPDLAHRAARQIHLLDGSLIDLRTQDSHVPLAAMPTGLASADC
jgi:putative ABC transport system ATP-binding protein